MQNIVKYPNTFYAKDYSTALAELKRLQALTCDTTYAVKTPTGETVGMQFDPAITVTGRYTSAIENCVEPYNFLINNSGLGHGWRLSFTTMEGYLTDDLEEFRWRLLMSDGRIYNLKIGSSDVTGMKDLQFNWNDTSYNGARYSLTYADGKKEYFDSNGRNIAIIDRFGNKITIAYTLSGGEVTEMRIVDTMGNLIEYKDEEITPDEYTYPGDPSSGFLEDEGIEFTQKHFLYFNGDIVTKYYSYENPKQQTRILLGVHNRENEFTRYNTTVAKRQFSCLTTSADNSSNIMREMTLGTVTYPNKLQFWNQNKTQNVMFGLSGYKQAFSIYYIQYEGNGNNVPYRAIIYEISTIANKP